MLWPEADCTGNHQKRGSLPATKVKQILSIRPPDLIIQDEFHLISGPLGTMVGLYETAVDELSTWQIDGIAIKPKIIASTATVRKADEQVKNVFLRQVAVFPPHGLDVEDNFFSVQRSINNRPGRRYLGICSPGSSRPAVLIRVYVALLTAAQSLFDRFGQTADPYMTVVGYFNSLRELGGMRRLAEDDVQTRAYRVQMSDVARPGLAQRSIKNVDELTSRVSSKDIPRKLDQLEVKYKTNWELGETRSIDIVLATNMLSVGVDVNRLGLMVVNGQPKNTAEYIQATSRVGRFFPGLICTVLTWARPRDLSHYETFEHYHATFYKHVEAQSVTPFAPRALDRALTGTMVSLLRLKCDELNPNQGAEKMNNSAKPELTPTKQAISDRAWKAKDKVAKQSAEAMIAERIDIWAKEANSLLETISDVAIKLHPDIAEMLANRISLLNDMSDYERAINNLCTAISKESIDKLKRSWQKFPEIKPLEVAAALRGATVTANSARNESIELVWTGPPTDMIPTRHTEQVLLEVIDSAKDKLFIVSFVTYNIEQIIRSLEKASSKRVQISILLEPSITYGGKVNIDSYALFKTRLPDSNIYKWKINQNDKDKIGGSMHAKCVVADGNRAFITSANLTMAAMERNMELGILVRGGVLPDTLHRHLESLVITNLVEKV